ncbi:MAG: hypothetical protein ACEPOZ_22270, partial [Marinifilaceae bacterium]
AQINNCLDQKIRQNRRLDLDMLWDGVALCGERVFGIAGNKEINCGTGRRKFVKRPNTGTTGHNYNWWINHSCLELHVPYSWFLVPGSGYDCF